MHVCWFITGKPSGCFGWLVVLLRWYNINIKLWQVPSGMHYVHGCLHSTMTFADSDCIQWQVRKPLPPSIPHQEPNF